LEINTISDSSELEEQYHEEQKQRWREYANRPEVKERRKSQYQEPSVKERKKKARQELREKRGHW
jgi:hypothetical protein